MQHSADNITICAPSQLRNKNSIVMSKRLATLTGMTRKSSQLHNHAKLSQSNSIHCCHISSWQSCKEYAMRLRLKSNHGSVALPSRHANDLVCQCELVKVYGHAGAVGDDASHSGGQDESAAASAGQQRPPQVQDQADLRPTGGCCLAGLH